MIAYARSKLSNMWQYSEMARRYGDLVTIAIHPGVVASGLAAATNGIRGSIAGALSLSTETGAQASLIAATQHSLRSGDYFHNTYGLMRLTEDDPAKNHDRAIAFFDEMEDLVEPFGRTKG